MKITREDLKLSHHKKNSQVLSQGIYEAYIQSVSQHVCTKTAVRGCAQQVAHRAQRSSSASHPNKSTHRDSVTLTMPKFWPFCPDIPPSTEAFVLSRLLPNQMTSAPLCLSVSALFSVLHSSHFKSCTGLKF